jgi:hypothetical protein
MPPIQQDTSAIQGLPAGAVLTPVTPPAAAPVAAVPDASQIQGLPAGAVLTPIDSSAPAAAPSVGQDAVKAVTGPTTALGAPTPSAWQQEGSGVSDILHGNFGQGASKIWDAEKPHVIQGSFLEKAIQKIDPSFQGSATPAEADAALASRAIVRPAVDVAQFIDKDAHPAGKAIAETIQSFTSPASVATLYATGGLGLVESPARLAIASRLISGGFSAAAIGSAYKNLEAFKTAYDKGDSSEAMYQLTHAITSGLLGVLAARGAASSEPITTKGAVSDAASNVARNVSDAASTAAGKVVDVARGAAQKISNPFRNTSAADAGVAVRGGTQAATEATGTADASMAANIQNAPVVGRGTTVVDEHLGALKNDEAAAYQSIDKTVGFDLKEAKETLKETQYQIKQPGVTPAAKQAMQDSINDLATRIPQAEAKLKAAGIDPKAGDVIHTQRMAGQDFRNSLVKATNPDGTLDINKLSTQNKNLQFSKRGNRLEQYMGDDGAKAYLDGIDAARKAGAKAITRQNVAKWVANAGVKIAGLGLGGEIIKGAIE